MQTDKEKVAKLREAMQHLLAAELLVKQALGDTDSGTDTRETIIAAIDDLMQDIIELDATV